MAGPNRSPFSVKDLQDVGETAELVIVADAKEQKRKKFLELMDDNKSMEGKKIKSINELENPKTMCLKGGGDRGKKCSQKLQEEKPAKGGHQRQTVVSATQLDGDNVCRQGFGRSNSPRKQQHGFRTRSKTKNGFCRRLSNVKDTMSFETITEISTSSLPTSSLRRLSKKSCASLREQVGASHGKYVSPSRADQLGICSICNKTFSNLSNVPGSGIFLCSVCRRKSKAVDPTFSFNTNFQIHAAKSAGSGQRKQKGKQKRDIIGGTPDTAMEIDSSDEEEQTANDTGSAMNPCEHHCQSGLQSTVKRMEGYKIAYPSRTDPEAVEILASDIQRLDPFEFLNDTIIDFYIKYIQREFLSLEGGQRFHFFSSFFYKKLSGVIGKQKRKKGADFFKLRKWTRGINIFEKEYLFIPVHDKLHWSLAIICFPNHEPGSASGCELCILHLDSMTCGHDSSTVFRLLRRYLVAEWKHTFGGVEMKGDKSIQTLKTLTFNDIPAKKVPVPLQENESDCGLFLLHYIRKFVESAPRTMKISDLEDRLKDIGLFGRQWFFPMEASSLRISIQEQLQRLFAQEARTLGMSSNATGTYEIGTPRNLEAQFCEESMTCKAEGLTTDEVTKPLDKL